jgi:hypothetical protein
VNSAFVGHGFHLKYTKSSAFFIDLMEESWPGVLVIDSRWSWVKLPVRKTWDLVVFWQNLPDRTLLDSITARSVVLVPMWDTCPRDRGYWEQFRDCGILCFSKALADLLEPWGHRIHRVQYFPEVPNIGSAWGAGVRKAFFWPRSADLGWPVARILLGGQTWDRVHLHITEGPEEPFRQVPRGDEAVFPIFRTRWFLDRTAMLKAMAECQVFLAPRRSEGIGMSFLEAMALGLAVVAPDAPTMNEYIQNGLTGYLYDPEAPVPVDFTRARACGENARLAVMEGRERWTACLPRLREFLLQNPVERPGGVLGPKARLARRAAWGEYRAYLVLEPLRWVKRLVLKMLTKEKR